MTNNRPVVRRTITLSEGTEALVRELALKGESFSSALTRLIEAGAWQLRIETYTTEPAEAPGGWRMIVDEARYREAVGEDTPSLRPEP